MTQGKYLGDNMVHNDSRKHSYVSSRKNSFEDEEKYSQPEIAHDAHDPRTRGMSHLTSAIDNESNHSENTHYTLHNNNSQNNNSNAKVIKNTLNIKNKNKNKKIKIKNKTQIQTQRLFRRKLFLKNR